MVYDKIRVQRCWAHKVRNVLNKVQKTDDVVKATCARHERDTG